MADSKKYDGSQWEHSLRKLTTATANIEPTIYTDGTAITAYTLKGNTVQNGTPTPSNPVEVNGVGVRTENLYNYQTVAIGKYINASGQEATSTGTGDNILNHTDYISVTSGENYYFKIRKTYGAAATSNAFCWFDSNKDLINRDVFDIGNSDYIYGTYTAPQNAAYLIVNFRGEYYDTGMLNIGDTAAEFEPHGYKIPISSGGVTTNIYLGSTQTTRQIYKFVLTGQENWGSSHLDINLFALGGIDNFAKIYEVTAISTHYQSQLNVSIWSDVIDKRVCFHASSASNLLYIRDSTYATVEDFTTFLSQQYAAGTPVIVYYVLATATTATVNEPLMKIGNYADTLSNATSIPTADGANSITVDTTVQPSEFTATWTGWHDASVKEWDGSQWNE